MTISASNVVRNLFRLQSKKYFKLALALKYLTIRAE